MDKGLLKNTGTSVNKYIQFLRQHLKDPLYRNSYYLMANTVVPSALGFFFWMVVARFYDDADVGLASTIITCMGLLVAISGLGFNFSLIRFLNKSEKPTEFINSALTITGISAIFTAFIFVIGVNIWSPVLSFIKDSPIFTAAFIAFTLCLTLTLIMDYIFIAKRKAGYVLCKNTAISLLKIILPFIFVLFFRSFGIVSSLGTSTGIIVIIFLMFFLPRTDIAYKPKITLDLRILREVWRYSAGNYFVSILGAAQTFILINLIVNRLRPENAAYFYVVWMISNLLFIVLGAISQSLFAEGSHFEEKLKYDVKRAYKFMFILMIPAITVLLIAGKWILLAFGAGYSQNGIVLLQLFALSGIFIGITGIYLTVLRVQERIREMIAIAVFSIIALLTGSYSIVQKTGIIGIGSVWFAVQALTSIYVIFMIKNRDLVHESNN